ncbi:unnamed protein product [Brassica oleracea]
MGRIIGVVNAMWARAGPRIFVHNVGEGEFLLRVTNEKTREMFLARTCWNVAGLPMFVAPWSPKFTPDEAPLTSAILPVELRDVPYLLFNKESLSTIATAVGKPVSLAPETERKENFKVAKLYVRVDLTKSLPKKIISGFSNGRETEISVSYPWLPLKCEACRKFGHSQEKCRTRQGVPPPRRRSMSPKATREKSNKSPKEGRASHHDKFPKHKPESSNRASVVGDGVLASTQEGMKTVPNVEIAQKVAPNVRDDACSDKPEAPNEEVLARPCIEDSSLERASSEETVVEQPYTSLRDDDPSAGRHGRSGEDNPFYLATGRKSWLRSMTLQ